MQEIKFSDIQRASASSSREEVYLEASTVASRVVGWNDSGQIVVRCESEEWAIASGAAYIRRNNDYGQVYRVTKEKQLRQVKKVVWI